MRILMIVPQAFYTTRGTPMSAYHRTRELVEMGHDVDILTYPIGDPPPNLDIRVYRSAGPHFYSTIKSGPSKRKIWFDFLLLLNLLYRLARTRYDALYTHEEAAFIVRMIKPLVRKPYVYDMHSSLPRQITDWKFSSKKWVTQLFEFVERQSVKEAASVVAISPAVAEAAKEAWPQAEPIIIVNYFGSEKATQEAGAGIRDKYGIDEDAKVVLYTGSFVALQALDMLIDAVPHVLEAANDAVFLLVGGTPPEIESLRKQAAELGVEGSVVFVESRPQSEMPAFLAAADVLVSPRIQGINPPGKLFSYLDSGRPVVATNCLVHNQLIDDSCAMLSEPNARAFAESVSAVLNDQQLAQELVVGANKFIEEYCSPAVREAAYGALVGELQAACGGAK